MLQTALHYCLRRSAVPMLQGAALRLSTTRAASKYHQNVSDSPAESAVAGGEAVEYAK